MTFLRSFLFNVAFFGATFLLALYGAVLHLVAPGRAIKLAEVWARLTMTLLRVLCGIRVQVIGRENLPRGAALIASRHQSAFDTLIWLTLVPDCCYVLKKELLRIPVIGQLMRDARMIAIDRSKGAASLRALVRDGEEAVRDDRQIIIFPEGTRAEPGALLPLQPGVAALAARTGLPVIPVITDSGRLWGRRAFHKRKGTIHIVILPPIPAGLKREDLMHRLRADLSRPLDMVPDEPGDNPR
ncbi:MAG: lysophospholipid acyltransferase family protein [Acetobacteraceae bacterium]